jgi:hypothetical protein
MCMCYFVWCFIVGLAAKNFAYKFAFYSSKKRNGRFCNFFNSVSHETFFMFDFCTVFYLQTNLSYHSSIKVEYLTENILVCVSMYAFIGDFGGL